MKKGLLYALGAYGLWGFLPIYWKLLQTVPALQILTHRMVWSLGFLLILMYFLQDWRWVNVARRDKHQLLNFTIIAGLLTLNWFIYIWAVNSGFIVETSLGYFINPLVSVLLGVVFLQEKLRWGQWVAISSAAAGVIYLTVSYGSLPWIALGLAFSFGLYGLLKKKATLNALQGLSLETMLLFPFAFGYLLYLEATGTGQFAHATWQINLLLVVSGVVTAIPLLLFAAAARRIPLSTLGLMQYIAPTIQLFIAVLLYNEPFEQSRLIGFGLVWLALLIYTVEGTIRRRKIATPAYAKAHNSP